jgi:hypothetical protein
LFKRTSVLWLAGLLVALVVLVARVAVDARAALRAGESAEARGDRAGAVRDYLDAARLYLPGSVTVRRALDHLEGIARTAEAASDPAGARPALEAIRAALLGTRSLYTPYASRLPDVERRLAGIYAQLEDPRVDPGASVEARTAWHASKLARHPGPTVGYVLLALLGLALWLGGAVGFMRRGLDAGLRLRRGPALAAGLIFVVGFALFVTGLRLA